MSGDLKISAQTVSFYDGAAFIGLPFGKIGNFGALVRTESLVLTNEAYGPDPPPYLAQTGPVVWTDDYPQAFRVELDKLPALVGYTFQSQEPFATGLFASTERRSYDFHAPNLPKRGLAIAKRDPLNHETRISFDSYGLLPTTVTDPAGLATRALNDYRVLQPQEVTDPNGNQTSYAYTPLGLLAGTSVKGKSGEGDQSRPSIRLDYEFLAFAKNRQPIFVRTFRICVVRWTVKAECAGFRAFGSTSA